MERHTSNQIKLKTLQLLCTTKYRPLQDLTFRRHCGSDNGYTLRILTQQQVIYEVSGYRLHFSEISVLLRSDALSFGGYRLFERS